MPSTSTVTYSAARASSNLQSAAKSQAAASARLTHAVPESRSTAGPGFKHNQVRAPGLAEQVSTVLTLVNFHDLLPQPAVLWRAKSDRQQVLRVEDWTRISVDRLYRRTGSGGT